MAGQPAQSGTTTTSPHWRRWLVGAVGLTLLGLAGALAWRSFTEPAPAPPTEEVFPPPRSSSPYRNTTAEARYVGSKACSKCHEAETESFRATGMGRSMARVVADRAPPGGTVDHPLSGRRYRIERAGGVLHHRELLRTPDDVVLSDFPLVYVVGSGEHALSYLAEADGFLVESPVSWYASHHKWDLSPSYDRPDQLGFQRPILQSCLMCHAGRLEAVDGSLHRFRFHELTIGCERCHGPGSLHLQRQNRPPEGDKPAGLPPDDTIVNPRHLSRALAEEVCEQCHRQDRGMVPVRGRNPDDYRPGLPLEEFRLYYRVRQSSAPLTLTGHVDQLRASPCYQHSAELSCLTCHNPHAFPKPAEGVAYYRAICQKCHETRHPCTNAAARDPNNGCVKCHMPTGATDAPHVAFTNHRIGLHDAKHEPPGAGPADEPGIVEPVHDLSHFCAADRNRSLGVAYLQLAGTQSDPAVQEDFVRRGVRLVNEARAAGLEDAILDSALCRMTFGQDPRQVEQRARKTLADADLPALDRCDALFILADALVRQERYGEAVAVLKDLNTRRREARSWQLLATCHAALGHSAEAAHALERAVAINTRLVKVHEQLAAYYEQKGDRQRAAYHRRRAPFSREPGASAGPR